MQHDARTFSPRGSSERAFTLVELVLVLIIVVVAVSIASLSLSNFVRSRDLSNTAMRFLAATRFARAEAMSHAVVYRININSYENRWWITHADETGDNFVLADTSGDNDCILSDRLAITCEHLTQDNVSDNNVYIIEFQPGGQVDPAIITLTGPNNGSIQIACDSRFDLYHIVPRVVGGGGTR